mmetsp:Transcript_20147/g.51480  ORF Transcript_20147/g.51480 Transcript_20147/m.51480 type:complete len:592 (+) Transcript_20147:93-1868(+)
MSWKMDFARSNGLATRIFLSAALLIAQVVAEAGDAAAADAAYSALLAEDDVCSSGDSDRAECSLTMLQMRARQRIVPSPSPVGLLTGTTSTSCGAAWKGCLSSRCCSTPGYRCYEKNQYWASCQPTGSCVPGLQKYDPHPTPWNCKDIDVSTTAPPDTTAPPVVSTTSEPTTALPDTTAPPVVPATSEPGSTSPSSPSPAAPAPATLSPAPTTWTPSTPDLTKPSSGKLMEFYMYRATSDEIYPPVSVNAGTLGGVLWYLHHEVVVQYPRKFGITKIHRFKVKYRPTEPLVKKGMNFGVRFAFDSASCTGPFVCGRSNPTSNPAPEFCDGAFKESYEPNITSFIGPKHTGPFEWAQYGYNIGCNKLGDFPFPMYEVAYPHAIWYSLPGPCASMTFKDQTPGCSLLEPGGLCQNRSEPTGAGDCTWNYELAGHVTLDDIVGIDDLEQFNAEGRREYDPYTDKGVRFSWWDGLNNKKKNEARVKRAYEVFTKKYSNMTSDEELPAPSCDFNFGAFYREFYYKDPTAGPCGKPKPGSACDKAANWGKNDGIYGHPEWYDGLTTTSTLEDFQELLYMQGKSECLRPCKGEEPPAR